MSGTHHIEAVTLTDVEWRDSEPWAIGYKDSDRVGFAVRLDEKHRGLVPLIESARDYPEVDGLKVNLDLTDALHHPPLV